MRRGALMAERMGFDVVTVMDGGITKTVTRFRCVECGATVELGVAGNGGLAPHFQAKRVQHLGWKAHPERKNACFCPRCSGPRKARKPHTTGEIINMAEKTTATAARPVAVPSPAPEVVAIKQPDQAQRLAIRKHLDSHFDDQTGAYLDGMTDRRIAELVGVPAVAVETIRVAAYGELRANPELLEMRGALKRAALDLHEMQNRVAALASKVEKALA